MSAHLEHSALGRSARERRTVEEVTRRERYAEAFWWIIPIPVLVIAAVGLAVAKPSPAGLIAVTLAAVVGLLVEVCVWRTFRRRWAGNPQAHPTAGIPDRLRWPLSVALAFGLLIAAIAWRATGLGESWAVGVVMGVGYIALVFAIGAVVQKVESRRYDRGSDLPGSSSHLR